MNEFNKQRMNHLSFFIKRSLNNLSYDPIVKQMERHKVSSSFIADRLVELFSAFIDKEREEYIEQITRDIKNAKESKQNAWEILKEQMKLNEKKMTSFYEKNTQLRQQLNSVQTIADSNQWKTEKNKESSMQKIKKIQNVLSLYGPFIDKVHYSASSVSDELSSIRNDVKAIQREFDIFLRNLNTNLNEKIENHFLFNQEQMLYEMNKKEIDINRSNQQLKSAMIDILTHINHKYQNDQLLLTMNSSREEFSQVLRAISSPFPLDYEYRKASYIRNKIEDKCNVFENEWRIKIQKQQKRINYLRSEFAKIEAQLKLLLEADSCIDHKLLTELENQHTSYMTITRNKTDNLMKIALSQSNTTIVSPDSDLNLPFSSISNE